VTVRVRLTLWYIVVVCVGFAVFAGVTVWQAQQAASAALDQQLHHRAQEVATYLRVDHGIVVAPGAADESGSKPGESTFWIRVLTPRGRVVSSLGPSLAPLPSGLLGDLRTGVHDSGRVRSFVLPIVRHGRTAAIIQMITTTDQVDAARRQLVTAMAIAGVILVLLAGLAGLFLANRALQPVDRITRIAGEIGESDLSRRVREEIWRDGRRGQRHDDELGRLAHTFDSMLARLEEASERRRQLTADAAHELLTPVATISSGAEIALRHPRTEEEYRATLQEIVQESQQLARVLDDLLLLARADAGRLPMEHEIVEVDDVCRHAVRAFEPLALEREISLTATIPSHPVLVTGDEMRLAQVIRNLLDNALRYTPPKGSISLSLESKLGPGAARGKVVIRVRDTGPGIPPDERTRIFERFYRVRNMASSEDRTYRPSGGSGLGLAICQAIVRAHGGEISVQSPTNSGLGAAFLIELPAIPQDIAVESQSERDLAAAKE
jgi:signal transduction histidine kinase